MYCHHQKEGDYKEDVQHLSQLCFDEEKKHIIEELSKKKNIEIKHQDFLSFGNKRIES